MSDKMIWEIFLEAINKEIENGHRNSDYFKDQVIPRILKYKMDIDMLFLGNMEKVDINRKDTIMVVTEKEMNQLNDLKNLFCKWHIIDLQNK